MNHDKVITHSIHRGLSYAAGLELQKDYLRQMKNDPGNNGHVFFVEHLPVITLGRSGTAEHLKADTAELERLGIEFHRVGRGGDVTFHGPGQWTVYPLLRLEDFCKDLHRYMRLLEDVVICYLASYSINGGRREGKTGVWVGRDKICAIGVSVSRWISWHGFALNINTDLTPFKTLMTPCGIAPSDGGVCSLREICDTEYNMEDQVPKILEAFSRILPFTTAPQPIG